MIYGKASTTIDSEHGILFVTVADTVSLKQGADLIRLTIEEAAELQQDLAEAIAALEVSNRLTTAERPTSAPLG